MAAASESAPGRFSRLQLEARAVPFVCPEPGLRIAARPLGVSLIQGLSQSVPLWAPQECRELGPRSFPERLGGSGVLAPQSPTVLSQPLQRCLGLTLLPTVPLLNIGFAKVKRG